MIDDNEPGIVYLIKKSPRYPQKISLHGPTNRTAYTVVVERSVKQRKLLKRAHLSAKYCFSLPAVV